MTTSNDLVTRVRSNINEPTGNADPQRSDTEIRQWLQDAQLDYLSKIPLDAVPQLISATTSVGSAWALPTGFLRLLSITVTHTITGTFVSTDPAYPLKPNETFLVSNYPSCGFGAWYQFYANQLRYGPNAVSASIIYVAEPTSMAAEGATFGLQKPHEEPIVNYATALALRKINDEEAAGYEQKYNERIVAENRKYGQVIEAEPEE